MSNRLAPSGSEESPADLSARVRTVVDQAIGDRRLVGAVVLVAHEGTLVHAQAAGLADREAAVPMAMDTVFRLASVTKPLVSVAALALVSQGRLELDDDVSRWLPDFRPRLPDGEEARISVRHLLSHRAGLGYRFAEPDGKGPYAMAGVSDGMDASGIDLDENLRRIANVPLLYAPGTAWGYSLATDVVGGLIERVTGQRLDVAIRELVTGPLAMTDTGFVATEPSRLAVPYVSDEPVPHRLAEGETVAAVEGIRGITFHPSRAFDVNAFPSGGAGMVGTAGDILTLLETLREQGGRLLARDIVAEMGRDQTDGMELPDAPGFGFGLGAAVLRDARQAGSPEAEGTLRWSGAYGHSWFMDRTSGLSVVALTNTLYEGMHGRFVTDLRDAIYGVAG